MSDKYDIAVIGAGPGGYTAAIRAAQLGAKVALIEKGEVGGTCLNRGCIPIKSLFASIELYSKVKTADKLGIKIKDYSIDYPAVIDRKDKIVDRLKKGVLYLLKENKIELIKGDGIVKSPGEIEVSGKKIESEKIIIATGSRPVEIPGYKIDKKKIVTSDEIFDIRSIPKNIDIIGAGVIGLQFATIFNEIGSKVTVFELANQVLPGEDGEIASALTRALNKKGIEINTGVKLEKPREVELTLVAVGRSPDKNSFSGVNLNCAKNFIIVNEKMEASIPGIYAVGDITGKVLLAHVASAQGKVAAEVACGKDISMDYTSVPRCIYTLPEVSAVGLTEEKAKEQGLKYKVGKFPFQALGKAQAIGEKEGFVKVIAEEGTDKLLGVHIIGPQATNLIQEAVEVIKLGGKSSDIAWAIHAHPTLSEAVMEAAENIFGKAIHILNK